MTRTAMMPSIQLRNGDVILEEGRKWRVTEIPVPQILDSGRVLWHVAAELLDPQAGDLYRRAGFCRYDRGEWLVQF